jgi:hypothetical protein
MDLNQILQSAQGGQGVNNLANQFGLTPEQTQAAISGMIPAFSQAMQGAMTNPSAIGSILSQIASGVHGASYSGAATPSGVSPTTVGIPGAPGGDVLSSIFNNPQIMGPLTQHISQVSGVSPQVLAQMMPAVASMIMGGLMHNMSNQGFGGVLGQLASAATQPGGLGSILGGSAPGAQAGTTASGGGLFGTLLNAVLGGGHGGAATPQSTAMQAGLNTLNSMLQGGVQVSQTHQQGLNSILESLSSSMSQPK